MHSVMIGAGLLLMALWLIFLPLRLAIDLRRALREQARSRPAKPTPRPLNRTIDDVE